LASKTETACSPNVWAHALAGSDRGLGGEAVAGSTSLRHGLTRFSVAKRGPRQARPTSGRMRSRGATEGERREPVTGETSSQSAARAARGPSSSQWSCRWKAPLSMDTRSRFASLEAGQHATFRARLGSWNVRSAPSIARHCRLCQVGRERWTPKATLQAAFLDPSATTGRARGAKPRTHPDDDSNGFAIWATRQ